MTTTPFIYPPLAYGVVRPIRTQHDVHDAMEWLGRDYGPIALDTETTGLAFDADVRLVQFGNDRTAWVFDPHEHPEVLDRLLWADQFICHNAPFDLLHIARLRRDRAATMRPPNDDDLVVIAKSLGRRTIDTVILAHLLDPRDRADGGIGHGLKRLAEHYVDPSAPDGDAALKARFRELGLRPSDGWASIPLWDAEFTRYSGADVLLTARLHRVLAEEVTNLGLDDLAKFEHDVQVVTMGMTARGFSVDLPYADALAEHLAVEQEHAERRAAELGVANINSCQQVATALAARGVTLAETTPSGAPKVDKVVLDNLDDELATVVLEGKTAAKSRATYVQPIIDAALGDGRVHCRIKSLAARTGRQSISQPPLQQLPSGDYRIRTCLVADPDMELVAADFSQIELRVVAALANEPAMISAFNAGRDLHDVTAERLFGAGFTSAQRRLAKGVSFGLIYGGGVNTLSRSAGVSKMEAKVAMDKFGRAFPRIGRWSTSVTEAIRFGDAMVVTATGRRIPVDRRFTYRAINYQVQSTSADIFKGSLLELDAAGFGEHLLLPVHDEVIAQAPAGHAVELAADMATTMSGRLGPVPVTAHGEVIGRSWGEKYRGAHV